MTKIQEKNVTVEHAFCELKNGIKQCKYHYYIKCMQALYFHELSTNPPPNTAIIQVDFSENANIPYQDEIQSTYWSHVQVALYTCVVWFGPQKLCYAVLSDYMEHDKDAVMLMNNVILDDLLQNKSIKIDRIYYFSDGAAAHFKQRYALYGVSCLCEKGIDVW